MIFHALAGIGALFLLVSIIPYLFWHLSLSIFCPTQDLKKRYDAKWALVTGASSGTIQRLAVMIMSACEMKV